MNNNSNEPDLTLFRAIEPEFKTHLELPGNARTILSGKFGSGKTTFLRHFFSKNQAEFISLTVYPVNYSIATNEDIFRYIKYDLLFELLRNDAGGLEGFDLGLSQHLYLFLKNNWKSVGANLIKLAGEVGKDILPGMEMVSKIATFMIEVKSQLDKHIEEASKKNDENRAVVEFMEETKKMPGSLYEETFITTIIEKLVNKLKEGKKQIVLTIEDLDRIDPEHIFRILNVFSAHFDAAHEQDQNRFGLDTILLVVDEVNIRKIFASRYGADVDYSGYIDKFFSHSIFNFDYSALLQTHIGKRLSETKLTDQFGNRVSDSIYNVVIGDGFVQYITFVLADNKMSSIRTINKVFDRQIVFADVSVKLGSTSVRLSTASAVLELLIIAELCGGVDIARDNFNRLKSIRMDFPNNQRIFERLLALVLGSRYGFEKRATCFIEVFNRSYYGNLSLTPNREWAIDEFKMRHSGGEFGIDAVRTDELFNLMVAVFELIQVSPGLRLRSYFF